MEFSEKKSNIYLFLLLEVCMAEIAKLKQK